MRIENRIELYRAGGVNMPEGVKVEGDGVSATQPASAVARVDKVQISDAGRALSAQVEGKEGPRAELSAERIAEIRQRIYEGAYNSVEVVQQVAHRMLERGDI